MKKACASWIAGGGAGLFLGLCVIACGLNCRADPVMPTLFSDHMVLQQGRKIQVWGNADPKEKITVSLGGQSSDAVTDGHGNWSVHLAPMSSGGPFTLTIHGKKDIVIKDVLLGEVWIASGQSNMTFSLDSAAGEYTPHALADLYTREREELFGGRLFLCPRDSPQDKCSGRYRRECMARHHHTRMDCS